MWGKEKSCDVHLTPLSIWLLVKEIKLESMQHWKKNGTENGISLEGTNGVGSKFFSTKLIDKLINELARR